MTTETVTKSTGTILDKIAEHARERVRLAKEQLSEADIRRINETLPSYKRIEYVELPEAPYEKTATRKIKRTLLPGTCSGAGITID